MFRGFRVRQHKTGRRLLRICDCREFRRDDVAADLCAVGAAAAVTATAAADVRVGVGCWLLLRNCCAKLRLRCCGWCLC